MNVDPTISILSDITVHAKYAKYIPELERREVWSEIVERNRLMHVKKYPELKDQINEIYTNYVLPKKVLPSMRSLQFGGKPIELAPNRVYNCAYLPVDSIESFSEAMFLLLGGTGVGYSVQRHHVEALPEIRKPNPKKRRRYLVGDSIEGWADAIKVLMKAYFGKNSSTPDFDFSDIREKGAPLITSGGKAPGADPLRKCLVAIEAILHSKKDGDKLSDIESHDIMCHIADAVLAGGIRRAALISLFSMDSQEMLSCKAGTWWELNPQRGRANNSAVIQRHRIKQQEFFELFQKTKDSGSGEPGFYFTNDRDWGTNPCCEIALRPYSFCNLTEVNVSNIESKEDFSNRVAAASFLGTLQAGYTDFHYLRDVWKKTTEKDALIGVSMTGIASMKVFKYDLESMAKIVKDVNETTANAIGINPAARTTTVKPAGTTSLVVGSSSGIHAWHNDFYLRRIRIGKNEPLYTYLSINAPELVEDEKFRPHDTAVISIPQKAPEGAVTRHESALNLLSRVKTISEKWVSPGFRHGQNGHNVSATISIRENEWDDVAMWMWNNRDSYNGLSLLPYDGGTYEQAPFEDISKEEFVELSANLAGIDMTKVVETQDLTDFNSQAACAGPLGCEVT